MLSNVCSLENKLDLIQLSRSTQHETRDCCVFVFPETWLNDNILDSAIQLHGLSCCRADRDSSLSGKTLGGGLCVYINKEWCVLSKHCSTLVEFMVVECRPFYLPHMPKKINNHFTDNRDSRSLWQAIQTITDYKPPPQACDDETSFPDALNHFYSRFEMQNDTPAQKLPTPPNDQAHCLSPADVRKTLSRINPRKAAGPDNIPGSVLKDCAEQLTDVFNRYLQHLAEPCSHPHMSQIHDNHTGTKKITCVLSKRLPSHSTDSNHNEVL